MQCPSKSNQNWKPSATKQFQKRPKKNACVLSLLYTIYIYIIQYSIVVPSGTLAMYDIVCHSHSLLFLQHQYYNNTTQIQLHQMVKGRRCLWAQQRGYVCCILSLSFRFALQLCTSQNWPPLCIQHLQRRCIQLMYRGSSCCIKMYQMEPSLSLTA